jgi:tripeptide aminopeptidase
MIEQDQALADLLELLAIPAGPGEEIAVVEHLVGKLTRLGVPDSQIQTDSAHRQSHLGGSTGNLIVRLDPPAGSQPGNPEHSECLLLAAHMDTVAMARGARPRLDGDVIRNAIPGKALGGDDRTGCAVLLQAARRLMKAEASHRPVTLLFTVQEEVGLVGARGVDVALLGQPTPTLGFNIDSDSPEVVYNAVIGTARYRVVIRGRAAHSGCGPEQGVSAALVAAHALAELHQAGWHGRIEKADGNGMANAGILRGGEATNIVVPEFEVWAEARSHDRAFRDQIVAVWQEAFRRAATRVRNAQGYCATVSFEPGPTYEPCSLPAEAQAVQAALKAIGCCGMVGRLARDDGGSDTNWLNAHGIPTVTLGCGQYREHTPDEYVDVRQFCLACDVAASLVAS